MIIVFRILKNMVSKNGVCMAEALQIYIIDMIF